MKRAAMPPRPIDRLLLKPEALMAQKRQAERAAKLAKRRRENNRGK